MSSAPPAIENRAASHPSNEKSMPYWEMLFRETIAIEMLAVVLVCMALLWNAPLEQLADPLHTANPAKAPWYFTGLQELLHYFPPFVAGIILPTLIVLSLIVIPFFNVNIKDETLWAHNKSQRLIILVVIVMVLTALLLHVGAWDALIPVLTIGVLMALAAQWFGQSAGKFQIHDWERQTKHFAGDIWKLSIEQQSGQARLRPKNSLPFIEIASQK